MAIAIPMLIVSSIEPFPQAEYMHIRTHIGKNWGSTESKTAGLAGR